MAGPTEAERSTSPSASGRPRAVLGMTLYNNAANLPHALESLLAQTEPRFALLLLDDASTDATGDVARPFVERDPRVRYIRHGERQAMIATWREVAEMAAREFPDAEYFAWVSDHDYWHPRWLERLMQELDADRDAVLAYPISRRMSQAGVDLQKGPRLFDTAAQADLDARWRHFCSEGVGAGDMVYGLTRMRALRRAGVFRDVLRPDRLLMAELTLQGRIRQVTEALWFRRQSNGTSVERQRTTLLRPGHEPRWFFLPPWLQHTIVLWREYATTPHDGVAPLSQARWARMLLRYQLTYAARHFRKTDTSHAMGRTINRAVLARKRVKHTYHHAVYDTLVGARALRGRLRRAVRRGLYEALMLTHRLGLRRRHEAPPS